MSSFLAWVSSFLQLSEPPTAAPAVSCAQFAAISNLGTASAASAGSIANVGTTTAKLRMKMRIWLLRMATGKNVAKFHCGCWFLFGGGAAHQPAHCDLTRHRSSG